MNCELVKNNLVLHLYGELSDSARFELEQHLEGCRECSREWESVREFRSAMDQRQSPEPSAYLLAASRIRLHDALENVQPAWSWRRLVLDPMDWLRQSRFSPALASALLIVGFTGGVLATFQISRQARIIPVQPVAQTASSIAGIRGIEQQPGSDHVQINYDTLQQQSAQGALDDPKIEQLLLYAARNQQNPGVRVESVDLLGQRCKDPQVRELMIYALRYDKNPGVRLKALNAIEGYVKQDLRVRDAVIEALLYDTNQGVRTQSIRALQPVKADSSVRSALRGLNKDQNSYIRVESQRMLASVANIE
jgi:anti-sigma factor RsiW